MVSEIVVMTQIKTGNYVANISGCEAHATFSTNLNSYGNRDQKIGPALSQEVITKKAPVTDQVQKRL